MTVNIPNQPTVADLLHGSIAAHEASKQPKGQPRDMQQLRVAYELRKQALAADPERTHPAWQEEQAQTAVGRDTHAQMMTFYREMLG